jgi:hypothetical protein
MDVPVHRARRLLQEVFGRLPGRLHPALVSDQNFMTFTGFGSFQGKQQEAITAVLSGQGRDAATPFSGLPVSHAMANVAGK